MRNILWLVLLAVCSASFVLAGDQMPLIAASPETIRPLLIGATIPDVTLASADGTPIDLGKLVAKQPSILIFYRGGW